jgi:F-type H+-transporting ATPase subunit epsilon
VVISVRNAIVGKDLGQLRKTVEREFLSLDEKEKNVRSVVAKMESSLIRGLAEYQRE